MVAMDLQMVELCRLRVAAVAAWLVLVPSPLARRTVPHLEALATYWYSLAEHRQDQVAS
jgi:hypothetical protein